MLIVEPRLNTSYPLLGSKIGDDLYCKATGKPYGIIVDITDGSRYFVGKPYPCYVVKSYSRSRFGSYFGFLLDGRSPLLTIETFADFIANMHNTNWLITSPVLGAKPSYIF
jgi:hypothetical protein